MKKKSKLPPADRLAIAEYKLRIAEIMKYSKVSEYGLTDSELRTYFGDLCVKNMGNWLDGQTCALTDDGQVVVYPEDIRRFVVNTRFAGNDLWD